MIVHFVFGELIFEKVFFHLFWSIVNLLYHSTFTLHLFELWWD